MPQPRKIPAPALAALQAGKSADTIAAELNVDIGTVYRYKTAAKASGLLGEVVPRDDAALIAGYLTGESVPAIARRLGIGRSTAYARVDRLAAAGIITKREAAPPQQRDAEDAAAAVDTAAGDVIAIVERPITEADDDYLPEPAPPPASVIPGPFPAHPAYLAEVYSRHGMPELQRRWPETPIEELAAGVRIGLPQVTLYADEPFQPLGVRLWRAVTRFFGGRS